MTFSRRQFLRRGPVALAAPLILSSSVLGRGGVAPPSERIGMGFIGLGGQGIGHLLGGAWTYVPGGYIARDDVQVLAVCDVRKERRDRAQARCNQVYAEKLGQAGYHGVQACNDFREVLARPDIDAVLLALPYHWHGPMALMAARAGKDVYCEKPGCVTIEEGRALVETFRRYGRVYQAGTQQRSEYGGKFRLACELVRNGRIGRLKEVYAYRQPGAFFPSGWTSDDTKPVPEGFDWDLYLGPLPWRPYGGHASHTIPGMFVGDVNWAPHHYDIIQWTLGADHPGPVEVHWQKPDAAALNMPKPQYPGGLVAQPGEGSVAYHFADGLVVHSTPFPGERVGALGGACFVGSEGRLAVDRDNLVSYPAGILKESLRPVDARVYHSDNHSANFLACVRTRQPTICDPATAFHSMSAVLVGGIALALQRAVKWDPAKCEFIGDEQANRLLSYTTRPPWRL